MKLSTILGSMLRGVAEGDKNNPMTKLYWKLEGKKTWIAVGVAALYLLVGQVLIPVFTGCGPNCGATPEMLALLAQYNGYLFDLSVVLAGVGLFDANLRLDPPKKQ